MLAANENSRCDKEPGRKIPVINRNKCEGKAPCVESCPFDVLTMGILDDEQKRGLSLIGKVKGFVHGYRQAMVVNPDACRACNQCVLVCPEGAIKLIDAAQ